MDNFVESNIVLIVIASVVIIYSITPTIKMVLKEIYLLLLLYKFNKPNTYIKEIEKDLNNKKLFEVRDLLLVNKMNGCFYAGYWDELQETSKLVSVQNLKDGWDIVYYIILIMYLFITGRIEDAQATLAKYNEILSNNKNKESILKIRLLYSINDFYNNELNKSENELKKILHLKLHKSTISIINYYLALIAEKQNRIDDFNRYIAKAAESGKNTFMEEIINKFVKKYQNNQ